MWYTQGKENNRKVGAAKIIKTVIILGGVIIKHSNAY